MGWGSGLDEDGCGRRYLVLGALGEASLKNVGVKYEHCTFWATGPMVLCFRGI